ncbi:MAG: hypothetical protein WAW00_00650 [Candidatus Moraniibacteriota bacterium]
MSIPLAFSSIVVSVVVVTLIGLAVVSKIFSETMQKLDEPLQREVVASLHKRYDRTFLILMMIAALSGGYLLYVVFLADVFRGVEPSSVLLITALDAFILMAFLMVLMTVVIMMIGRAFSKKVNWAIGVQQNCERIEGTLVGIREEEGDDRLCLSIKEDGKKSRELYMHASEVEYLRPSRFEWLKVVIYYNLSGNMIPRGIVFMAKIH